MSPAHLEPTRIDTRVLKDQIDLRSFYGQELDAQLFRHHGWCDGGLCPFHEDKSAGSFKVNLSSGAFRCFSCSKSGGDVIDFVQLKYGLSFKEALNYLLDFVGGYYV